MACPFCNIESGERNRIIDIRDHTIVFFSNPRLMPGHLLVIPKRHVLHLSELDAEERKELFDVAIEYQDRILKHVASGCFLEQHNMPFVPQNNLKVDHVHLHLLPREFGDDLYAKSGIFAQPLFQPLTHNEITRIETLLRT